jgi:hypothetical protein
MFIKRSVLNEIGILDEENFNKGYGEENDFCCRAIEHGYINVLCDDTFIYHKGSMSFKEQTKKYIEENSVVLKKKYPYYFKNISEFIKKNPLSDIHENIKLHIKLNNKKRNVLYIFHNNTFLSDNCLKDAPELHLRYLIEHINEINRFVLISNGKQLLLIALVDNDKIYFKFDIQEEITYTTFHLYQYENILEQIITGFNIDLIHVQHLKNHTLDITEVALRLGIPKVITLYDFYMLCPLGDFINSEGKKCTSFIDQETCLRCVKNKMGYNSDFLKTWNNRMKSEIKKYDKIFTSIEFIKDVVEKYYDDLSLNIEVVESDITAMKPVVEIEKNKAEEGTNNTKLIDYNIRDEIINKYLNEYNKLINAFKGKMDVLLSNFDPYLIYNSYKNIYHNNLYKDLYFSILNVIDKNIWERYVKNISSKINIDTDLLSYMKFYLSYLINKFKNEKVDYVIWGAGSSGRVTKIILEEIMPNMKLIGYVDKFKEGNIEGVKVHKPENLKDVKFNYIIIATSSGKDEAEEFLNNMNLSMLNNYIFGYGVIPNHRYDIQKNIRHIWDI